MRKFSVIVFGMLLSLTPVMAQKGGDAFSRAENHAAAGRYKEAFEQLRNYEQSVSANARMDKASKAAAYYNSARVRMNMYMRMRKSQNTMEQLERMEVQAGKSGNDSLQNDFLYNKAIYHYSFGQLEKGNAVFAQMVGKLTASKEYDKVDKVYQTLIKSSRTSGSAMMVAQTYSGYMAWKDSANVLKLRDVTNALNQQIQARDASIAEKDSLLSTRQGIIIVLCVILACLAAVLVAGGLMLMRLMLQTRSQKKTIADLTENIALKAKFTGNISAQLTPALQRLDASKPEVKALLDFSNHIQTLSQIESSMGQPVETESVKLPTFCEELAAQVRGKLKNGVTLNVDVPAVNAQFNREYVTHILLHLLNNAAEYTPENGFIRLEYKKRSAHKCQFIVSNTGEVIPEEKREMLFKPFVEVRDLTTGDGLGLPICRQMTLRMNGDLSLDPEFTKGTRFVLTIEA